jgi:hypothetical protein
VKTEFCSSKIYNSLKQKIMKNTILKNRYSKIFIKIFSTVMLAALILMIVQSCGKEDTTQPGY